MDHNVGSTFHECIGPIEHFTNETKSSQLAQSRLGGCPSNFCLFSVWTKTQYRLYLLHF